MKIKLSLFILLAFVFISNVSAQEKVIIDQDTLVIITPNDVKTINGIIVDWEFLKKESALKDSLIKEDSILISAKDSVISVIEEREKKKETYYIEQASTLVKENKALEKKLKRKKTGGILGTIGGTVLGILLGLIIH